MDAVGVDRKCDVGAGVDQKASWAAGSSNSLDHDLCQCLELVRTQVLFAKLNEVDATPHCVRDPLYQTSLKIGLSSGELRAVGDVVEKQDSGSWLVVSGLD